MIIRFDSPTISVSSGDLQFHSSRQLTISIIQLRFQFQVLRQSQLRTALYFTLCLFTVDLFYCVRANLASFL